MTDHMEAEDIKVRVPIMNKKGEVYDVVYVNLQWVITQICHELNLSYVHGTDHYMERIEGE